MKLILLIVILFIGTMIFAKIAHFTDRNIPRAGLLLGPIFVSWSFICVYVTQYFTNLSSVTWDWLYWVVGIAFCVNLPAATFGETASDKNATETELVWARANVKLNFVLVFVGLGVALWLLVFRQLPEK